MPKESVSWGETDRSFLARIAPVAGCLAVGTIGALLFVWLRLPLPWFLGSLVACLLAVVAKVPLEKPLALNLPARIVLGVAIGTAFTPAVFENAGRMSLSLLALAPWTLAIVAVGVPFFERFAGFDRATAFFATVPGGLADMIVMAEDSGANTRSVTLVQSVRILLIVFVLPLIVSFEGGLTIAGAGANATGQARLMGMTLGGAATLIAAGVIGWQIALRLRLAGPAIIGPMVLSAALHATGVTSARVPFEIMTIAQVVIGASLGAQFRGLSLAEFGKTVRWGILFSALLLAATTLISIAMARLTGFPLPSVLLAFAPGGQVELNLLAFLLGLDVAFIALHHLVRLAVVMVMAQVVFRRLPKPGDTVD